MVWEKKILPEADMTCQKRTVVEDDYIFISSRLLLSEHRVLEGGRG